MKKKNKTFDFLVMIVSLIDVSVGYNLCYTSPNIALKILGGLAGASISGYCIGGYFANR